MLLLPLRLPYFYVIVLVFSIGSSMGKFYNFQIFSECFNAKILLGLFVDLDTGVRNSLIDLIF
jgi:hypothetical protein